ncbi:MAG: GGDEF domain-containing protein [Zoogloea sp.]|nr:GGDEF domain-containing protein [Zoogloea sp.]
MSTPLASALLEVLSGAEALSRQYDRDDLFRTASASVLGFLKGRIAITYAVRYSISGPGLVPVAWSLAGLDGASGEEPGDTSALIPPDPVLSECIAAPPGPPAVVHHEDGWRIVFSIGQGEETQWLLEVYTPHLPMPAILEACGLFLKCFHNQLRHWEYANLDTLTRLLNRKTFDDQFEHLIDDAEKARRRANDRRDDEAKGGRPCWLGVVDIDHFKRINDGFGHLFGDEVLLLVANVMRGCFRTPDKLYRFGGEEFVVMLRHVRESDVEMVFERFREAIEIHEFPQVGRVTCSIGYTHIDPALSPAELLGRADQALYYSKEHGRNRVSSFDTLLRAGNIQSGEKAASSAQAAADRLFN